MQNARLACERGEKAVARSLQAWFLVAFKNYLETRVDLETACACDGVSRQRHDRQSIRRGSNLGAKTTEGREKGKSKREGQCRSLRIE